MTEVATPAHVDAALNAGMTALWIGARTTVSPFAVQALADALRGTDVTVLVKNPMHADLKLWLGAIERIPKIHFVEKLVRCTGFFELRSNGLSKCPNVGNPHCTEGRKCLRWPCSATPRTLPADLTFCKRWPNVP